MEKRAIRRHASVSGVDRDNVVDAYGNSIIGPDGRFDTAVAEDLVEALNHRCPPGANVHQLRAAEERAALAAVHLDAAEAARRAAVSEAELLRADATQLRAELAAVRAAREKAENRCGQLQAQVDALAGEVDRARLERAMLLRVLCDELGGEVDEVKTGPENYLQRVRALRQLEADAEQAAARAARRAS